MLLFLAFLLVPLIEIALFIQVGGLIGLWPTLGIVVATAILGTWLVRNQGRMALGNLQRSFGEMRDPSEPLAHGAMILFAGALLLTPGFFTDAVGFALLVPQVRTRVFGFLASRVQVHHFQMSDHHPRDRQDPEGDIIDGEWEVAHPDTQDGRTPSGWVRGPGQR